MATVIRAGIAIVADLLIYELNQLQHKKNRRRRRMWIREWIKRRDVFGASATFLREVELEDPETFRNHLRLTTNQFQELLSVVKDFIKKKDTLMRPALEPRIKLQITMRYLATGDSFSTLEHMYRIPKSTISKFLPQVLKAIYEGLKDYVKVSLPNLVITRNHGSALAARRKTTVCDYNSKTKRDGKIRFLGTIPPSLEQLFKKSLKALARSYESAVLKYLNYIPLLKMSCLVKGAFARKVVISLFYSSEEGRNDERYDE
ncbi:hypothetical protein MML48_1g12284 [Holotrichia oblita]|uniref:Uncharacterized protein n=1 Tax=Holotrichia oblita TaxID=644536 RepID=A0ACB9TSL1_HOLOL|nr:hypothetical protein MML48_1g12284 [Holotrichia oblita]